MVISKTVLLLWSSYACGWLLSYHNIPIGASYPYGVEKINKVPVSSTLFYEIINK